MPDAIPNVLTIAGSGPERRRRHPGRPEDVLGAGGLWRLGHHRADRAEHPGRARFHGGGAGIRCRPDRRGVRRFADRCGEDRHGCDRGDCLGDRRPAAALPAAQRRARPGDGGEERRPAAAGRRDRRDPRAVGAAGDGDHAQPAGGGGAVRRGCASHARRDAPHRAGAASARRAGGAVEGRCTRQRRQSRPVVRRQRRDRAAGAPHRHAQHARHRLHVVGGDRRVAAAL